MHHLYHPRFFVNSLCQMGFYSSYGEMQRFEKNCAAPNTLGKDIDVLNMANNVDHNILFF